MRIPVRVVRVIISGVVGLLIWELCARFLLRNPLFLPTPYDVLQSLSKIIHSGELLINFRGSVTHFLVGSLIGFFVGVLLGIGLGANQRVADYLDPWVSAAYSAPLVALTPLLIIWFGIGLWSKAFIIALLVVFPVTIGTVAGIRSTDPALLEVATSFGATPTDLLRKVMVPWAFSFVLSGARIGVGRGVIGIFVAELFGGSSRGLGLMIVQAAQTFDTPLLFVGVMILASFGIAVTSALRFLERRLAPWRPQAVV